MQELIIYSTKETAKLLDLSTDHIRLLVGTGIREVKKIGRDWIVLYLNHTWENPKERN